MNTTLDSRPPAAVHEAIVRVVRPGREQEFEKLIERFFRDAAEQPGVCGAYLMRPFHGTESRQYGIVRSFASDEQRDRFYQSDVYRQWNEAVRPLVEGEAERHHLHGLEAFFPTAGSPPPWKMALVTWLGVNVAVYIFSLLFSIAFANLPALATLLLVNACVVAALTWVLMPLLTRIFARWLRPRQA